MGFIFFMLFKFKIIIICLCSLAFLNLIKCGNKYNVKIKMCLPLFCNNLEYFLYSKGRNIKLEKKFFVLVTMWE